jgi:hypothetical protein
MATLQSVRALEAEGDLREALESFISQCLHEAGVWASPCVSDGVSSYRVIERGPHRTRICGRIWEIDQTQRSFCVEVERQDGNPRGAIWKLFFDIDDTQMSPRRARLAVDVIDDPTHVQWRVALTGRAE